MRVAVTGTSGPLHDGHRALLNKALEGGDDGELAEITRQRTQNRLDPIESIVVPYVRADDGERISSTRMVRVKWTNTGCWWGPDRD